MNNKYTNIHIYFSILLLIAFPLTIIMTYISFEIFSSPNTIKNSLNVNKKDINSIIQPTYDLPQIIFDSDLSKFPSDYDTILETLEITLSQHEKTALLLYGQTVTKSNHTDITSAYKDLIEKDIPLIIPQQYINEYFNNEFGDYNTESTQVNVIIGQEIENLQSEFDNLYDEYIYNQLNSRSEVFLQKKQENILGQFNYDYEVNNAIFQTNSDNINELYYKAELIKYMFEDSRMDGIISFLEYVIDKSTSTDALTIDQETNEILKEIIFNKELNKDGEVYWKISVLEGTSYVYPIYISDEFIIDDNNFDFDYDIQPITQTSGSVRVPILMYHNITDIPNSTSAFVQGLYVTPDVFEQQLAYLVKKNYKSLSSQDFYNLLLTVSNPNQKCVMITFDDSTPGHYKTAYPILKKYGFIGIFNIPSNRSGITYAQLREMAHDGMIIESHSATHIDLSKESNPDKLYSEIAGSKSKLRGITDQDVISISYPGCVANKDVYSQVSKAGYLLGLSCGRGIDHYYSNRLSLSRVHVYNSLDNFINLLSGIN